MIKFISNLFKKEKPISLNAENKQRLSKILMKALNNPHIGRITHKADLKDRGKRKKIGFIITTEEYNYYIQADIRRASYDAYWTYDRFYLKKEQASHDIFDSETFEGVFESIFLLYHDLIIRTYEKIERNERRKLIDKENKDIVI